VHAGPSHAPASGAHVPSADVPNAEPTPHGLWWPALRPHRPLVEIAGVFALYVIYELSRGFVLGEAGVAYGHAQQVIRLEGHLHLLVEGTMQHNFAVIPGLLSGLSFFYVGAHLTVTIAILVWLYRRKPGLYARARTTLALASFAALAGYWLYPTMPPRLAAAGVTDSVSRHTPVNLSSTLLGRFYNPYAAVPSMHFGYALLVGVLLARYARRPAVRLAGAAYPALVLLAIVSTGNHYFFDALVGGVVVVLAWLAVNVLMVSCRPHRAALTRWASARAVAARVAVSNERRVA
jgi:PAP2 superfamily